LETTTKSTCIGLGLLLLAVAAPATAAPARSGPAWCGTQRNGARDVVWAHRARRPEREVSGRTAALQAEDVGQVAVLYDDGDLIFRRNPVDLQGIGVQFAASAAGYRAVRLDQPPSAEAGEALALGDDDSVEVALPFPFPFYGQTHTSVYVNSDGNLTFGAGDTDSSTRSLGRMVAGPPRIAPLFADFDPSAGGQVVTSASADRFRVSWRAVPQYGLADANSFEATLFADGRIEMVYGSALTTSVSQGQAGIAPGVGQNGVLALDLSGAAGSEGAGALIESFTDQEGLDTPAVARKFLATHPDDYTYLVVFASQGLVTGNTFAYEQTVQNDVRGIGIRPYDFSAEFGSAGRLESFVFMDAIGKYPDDLTDPFLGTDSALAVLAHETGHRWLADAVFRDGSANSRELLGRDGVHWSFFMDTDASHLEGNDLNDLGGGQFQTASSGLQYSALDQYLMGFLSAAEVPPFFFARDPSGLRDLDPGRSPRPGITFTGTRVDVTVDMLVEAMGPRTPAVGEAPTVFRQAYVYLVVDGAADPADIERVDRFRQAFEAQFLASTGGRAQVDTRLH